MTDDTVPRDSLFATGDLWEQYERAEKLGFYTARLIISEHLLLDSPDDTFWRYLYAKNLFHVGHHTRALDILQSIPVEDSSPFRDRLELLMGQIYKFRGEFDLAEMWFRRAMVSKPHDTAPRIFLGSLLAFRERFGEACVVFGSGMDCEGDVDELFVNLAKSQRALGNFVEAQKSFRRALEISPDYSEAKRGLADVECAIALQDGERKTGQGGGNGIESGTGMENGTGRMALT